MSYGIFNRQPGRITFDIDVAFVEVDIAASVGGVQHRLQVASVMSFTVLIESSWNSNCSLLRL
ncbi:hypothetical protein [Methylobacter svalbardensis]|uniref:hypothetical protein n=1 Tax=Methylobacter svalbardensis TaxID=3080016 RepID=UPI0030EDF958